ncbi:hypothetical protein BDN67DRAFT_913462, partial [Paxillus ammoniavirescens]
YDINCQYMKNLGKRLTGNAFIAIPPDLPIVPSIGIWHVHSHQAKFHARYAQSFIPGAGRVDGEIIETLWSILNIISPSARGMSFPHRQELLDYQMNDSNFQKMIRMGMPSHCLWTFVSRTDFADSRCIEKKAQSGHGWG